jgi:transposase
MKQKGNQDEQAQLNQLSKKELVQLVIEGRQKLKELEERIIELTISLNLNSKNSSKPPSTDLLKKSEKPKPTSQKEDVEQKRKPGGQPGHQGSTRKGFNRVDRVSLLSPSQCQHCGRGIDQTSVIKTEKQQVAQLVARPIEIVEYHRQHCQCAHCGLVSVEAWDSEMIPGQDLGIKLHRTWASEFQNRIDQQITKWKVKAGQRAGQLLRSLEDKRQQWWYFLEYPHIPPDNNLAERDLPLAVTKRKISGGSRSMERFEQTAKLLSVVQTCRRQGHSVIAFFGQALKATLGFDVVPSLIPSSST